MLAGLAFLPAHRALMFRLPSPLCTHRGEGSGVRGRGRRDQGFLVVRILGYDALRKPERLLVRIEECARNGCWNWEWIEMENPNRCSPSPPAPLP